MRKIFLVLSLLGLAACDKPTSNTELTCSFTSGWDETESRTLDYQSKFDMENIIVGIKTYDDYAVVTMNGKRSKFERKMELFDSDPYQGVFLEYVGRFPGKNNRKGNIGIYVDIDKEIALQYNIVLDGEKIKMSKDADSVFDWTISCEPTNSEERGNEWSARVPFHHKYQKPNDVERCITQICDKVYCVNAECSGLVIKDDGDVIELSQKDALKITPNWDYSNMRLYNNSDKELKDYEYDACHVLARINQVIKKHKYEKNKLSQQ